MKGIYIGEVAKILGLSAKKVAKLADEGALSFSQATASSKRIFNKEQVLNFLDTDTYKGLRKSRKLLAYVRCTTKKQERTILKEIKKYCATENWKLTPIVQLDRGIDEVNNLAYAKAVKLFRENKVQGFIHFGNTKDIHDLAKMFKVIPDMTVLDAAKDLNKTEPDAIRDSAVIRTQTAMAYS